MLALADAAKVTPLVKRLVELLSTRDRLALLPDVAEAYAELANAAHGVVAAEVVSAVPLAAEHKRALEAALKGTAASVELRTRVDPSLIGGLVVSASAGPTTGACGNSSPHSGGGSRATS